MRVAVLGLGSMGRRHAANAIALGHEVRGFDPDPDACADLAGHGGLAFGSEQEALERCDTAVVASPTALHLRHAAQALGAGCHVLVEKPLADRVGRLEELCALARAQRLVFAVAQNLRYHPAVVAARGLLARGAIGRPILASAIGASPLVDWRPGRDHRAGYAADAASGGVVFDWVHEIDMLAFLLGPPRATGAVAENSGTLGLASEESACLLMRHPGGTLSTVALSYLGRPERRACEIIGDAGRLEVDIPARRLSRWDSAGMLVEHVNYGGIHADDYALELKDFLAATTGASVPACSAEEGLAVLREVLALRAAAGLPCNT